MITKHEAERALQQLVVYRAPHVPETEPGEEGVITSVNDRGAFVRYGTQQTSQLTPFDRLTLVRAVVSRPDSASHFICPKAPNGETHHLVPWGGIVGCTLQCEWCKQSEDAIKEGALV